MQDLSSYTIESFSGGLSDEAKRGVAGSFRRGWNLNIHAKGKNRLSCNQKLKKISGSVVTDLIIKIVPVTAIKSYGFGDSGCVYKIENETVTKIYTDGNGEILDATFFYGYLYWTTNSSMGRCIETSANWIADAVINYQALNPSDCHPLFVVPKSDLMTVGNGRYIATFNSVEVWNNEALDLYYGWEVRCLTLLKPNLLIGAKDSEKAEMFSWDLTADSYDPVEGWEERDINAFLKGIGATYVFTPELLYWYNQGLVDIAKELPSQIKHGALDIWKGKILMGATNGVYSYHRKNKNYPLALNLEYTASPITIANYDSKSIGIGAVLGRGDDLLVSWKDGGTYGLDNVDIGNKAEATFESLMFDAKRPQQDKWFRYIKIITAPLPASCSVQVKYKNNEASSWTSAKMADTSSSLTGAGKTKGIFQIEGQGEIYEVRAEIYPHDNDTPEILSINNYFEISNNY